jgi:hypothetical protein
VRDGKDSQIFSGAKQGGEPRDGSEVSTPGRFDDNKKSGSGSRARIDGDHFPSFARNQGAARTEADAFETGQRMPGASATEPRGGVVSSAQYIIRLAQSFPCLHSKFAGLSSEKWDAIKVEKMSRAWSTGERFCILFVLAVWAGKNGDYPAFDVVDAMGTISPDNRIPIIDWIAKPYWP